MPWGIPESAAQTQRIVRLAYDGPEGDGTLKLVLRIESQERFRVQASDRLGRRWWDLHVGERSAIVSWPREKQFCRVESWLEVPTLPLGPVPLEGVPALLLHRLPMAPQGAVSTTANEGVRRLEFRDAQRRVWMATVSEKEATEQPTGALVAWQMWTGGEAQIWWTREGDMAYLSAPGHELQLRWQQTSRVSELRSELGDPSEPAGYERVVCAAPEALAQWQPAGRVLAYTDVLQVR